MIHKKTKFWMKISFASILTAGLISLPIISTINFSNNPTSFDKNKIGVYAENRWISAFELAIEKYNDLPGEQTPIQLLEAPSVFGAFEKIDTLGYRDQAIADLIYLPLDRIPKFAERDKALLYFDSPDSLFEGLDASIWNNDPLEKELLAAKGLANVTKEDGTTVSGYFGLMHNVEAIVMFTKGDYQNQELFPTLQSIINATVDADSGEWIDPIERIYAMKFNDLWLGIGIIAAFLNTTSGLGVGQSLVSIDPNYEVGNQFKYYSAMSSIEPLEEQVFYQNHADELNLPELKTASASLSNAIDFLFQIWNYAMKNNNSDWHVFDFGRWFEKFSIAIHAAYIGGSWDASVIRRLTQEPGDENKVKVQAVPNPTASSGKYAQGPGGWMYAINQRNYGNAKRIADMKDFVNILLTDEDVILEQYNKMDKMIAGYVGKEVLTTNNEFNSFDKTLIQAVYDSIANNSLDFRPDNGNQEFNQVWGAWDGEGWSSVQVTNTYRESIINEAKIEKIKGFLQTSFSNMLARLHDQT